VPEKKVHIEDDYISDSKDSTYLDIVHEKGFNADKVDKDNFLHQEVSFELYLNIKRISSFYHQLGAVNFSFDEFKFAFLTKELSLIRYGTVEYMSLVHIGMPYEKNPVWEYIFMLLEIRRCNYLLSCDFPSFSHYIDIYNKCIRQTISVEMIREDMGQFQHVQGEFEQIRTMLEHLYALVVHHQADEHSPVCEYALPFVLAAARGTIHTSADAAKAIYNYILLPNKLHKIFRFRFSETVMEIEDVIEDHLKEERPIIQADEAIGFYRDVLIKRMNEIVNIRNVFKRIFSMTEQVEVYDGDIDLRKQQQLYLDSITGDEGRTYLQRRFKNTTLDVVLLRDISFSTDLIRVEYAQAIIILMAALEGIAAVRTAQIDFSDMPKLNKTFDQPISQSGVAPDAFGATIMAGAMDMLEHLDFRASRRLVFIITDGQIEDFEHCQDMMEQFALSKSMQFFMINITSEVYGEVAEINVPNASCSVSMLAKVLYQILLKELVQ